MAVNFTNNYKNILDKLRDILRTEFKGTLPVYIGHEQKVQGTQYLRLDPIGSDLIEYNNTSELREFTVDMYFYFSAQALKLGYAIAIVGERGTAGT